MATKISHEADAPVKMGRPTKDVDWDEFDKLCALQCTLKEIACWFSCSVDTIENKCKSEKGMRFSDYYEERRGTGKVALRRAQFNMALKNPTMAIWLGKNWLEQTDKNEVKNTHAVGPEAVLALQDVLKEILELKKAK